MSTHAFELVRHGATISVYLIFHPETGTPDLVPIAKSVRIFTAIAGHTADTSPAIEPRGATPRAAPHRHRTALLAALRQNFTAVGWLDGKSLVGTSALSARSSSLAFSSAPSQTSAQAPALAESLGAEFGAAEGRQWLLAKGLAAAERVGLSFESLRSTHDQLRISLCTLWQVQVVKAPKPYTHLPHSHVAYLDRPEIERL